MQLRADKAPGNAPFAVQHKGRGRGAHIAPLARKRAIAVMRYRVRRLPCLHGGDVAMEGYRKALEADTIARGQQAPLQQEAMSQQGALAQAALREQGEMARARMNGALAQGRLDLAQRQQQQAERMGAIERGMAGLGFSRALRLEQAQNDLLNARNPQEQEQARQRLNLLAGNAAARENPKDNYTTLTGPNGE